MIRIPSIEKKTDNYDNYSLSTQETKNYTDLHYYGNADKPPSRTIMNTRRNKVLSGILNCDVNLGSSQITITDLDRSSLRKRIGNICNDSSSTKDETINDQKTTI